MPWAGLETHDAELAEFPHKEIPEESTPAYIPEYVVKKVHCRHHI